MLAGEEVVAAFLHARFSTPSRSSSLALGMPKRKGKTLRHKRMDNIRDTRCMIPNVTPRRPWRQKKRRYRPAAQMRKRERAESRRGAKKSTTHLKMYQRRL